jgi:hypothetical protein
MPECTVCFMLYLRYRSILYLRYRSIFYLRYRSILYLRYRSILYLRYRSILYLRLDLCCISDIDLYCVSDIDLYRGILFLYSMLQIFGLTSNILAHCCLHTTAFLGTLHYKKTHARWIWQSSEIWRCGMWRTNGHKGLKVHESCPAITRNTK